MQNQPALLIADNDPKFARDLAKILESLHYHVLTACGFEQAQQTVNSHLVHVAIINVRLEDENNAKDESGLNFARGLNQNIAKIIVAGQPTWELTRDVLFSHSDMPPLAAGFISKEEGLATLLAYIESILVKHVKVNFALKFSPSQHNAFSIISNLHPDLSGEELVFEADIFIDLLRRVFYTHTQVRLERILWSTQHRIAVGGFASKNNLTEAFVLVCGDRDDIQQEYKQIQVYSQQIIKSSRIQLRNELSVSVYHLAAYAFILPDTSIEKLRSLKDIYQNESLKTFRQTFEAVYNEALAIWNSDFPILREDIELHTWYQQYFNLNDVEALSLCATNVVKQSMRLGHITMSLTEIHLSIEDSRGTQLYYNPISAFARLPELHMPCLLRPGPGHLSNQNIFAIDVDQAILSDFQYVGLLPVEWGMLTLEADIRYRWGDIIHLQRLYEFEKILTISPDLTRFEVNEAEPEIRKLLSAIKLVRGALHLSRLTRQQWEAYHLGIYFSALAYISTFQSSNSAQYTQLELAQYTHALISAAMLATQLLDDGIPTKIESQKAYQQGLFIDVQNRKVWRDGILLSVPKLRFDLLYYLYQRDGQLCTHAELYEHLWNTPYDENNKSHTDLLNITISRLRDNIEFNTKSPRYLINQRGDGFMLYCNPVP